MSKLIVSDRSQPKNLLEELQASFLRRFSKVPQPPEPVVYEFTNDRALLHQYFRLRETMYRKVFQTDKFVGEEDLHDKLSHVLIARRGKLCIGGCRLTIREADEDFLLPMETQDFKLRNIFPTLPLKKFRHGEISRFAIMDEDEDVLDVMRTLVMLIVEKCVGSELAAAFLKSSLPMARNWRKLIQIHCGQNNVKICTGIDVPENPIHPEIKWYITQVLSPVMKLDVAGSQDEMAVTRPAGTMVH